jgi:hypothetical protein
MIFSMRYWVSIHNSNYSTKPLSWSVLNHVTQQRTFFEYKADALLFKKKLPHATVYFHWYEQEMAKLQWDKEPVESYDELCRQRAQELRDTYNYIRLWYSGGADSHSALMSFVKNNIHVDEIVIMLFPDQNVSDVARNSTANEVLIAAFPQLKSVIGLIPKTKITVVDANEKDIEDWFNTKSDTIPTVDSLDGDGAAQFFLDVNWGVSKVLAKTDMDNWCDIHGGTKAKLYKNQDKWYAYFVDSSISTFYMSDRSEDFFISRSIPKLFLKTVYNYKNYHKIRNSDDHYVNHMYSNPANHIEYNRALGRDDVHEIAAKKVYYSTHDPEQWRKLYISGVKAMQFYNNVINTEQGQRWYQQHVQRQKTLINEYDGFWNVDAYNNPVPYLGYKGHLSNFYCLNDGKIYDSTQVGYK